MMLRFLADLPVRAIAWLSDSLEKMLRAVVGILRIGDADDAERRVGLVSALRRALGAVFWALAQLVLYPILGFFFRGARLRAFLWSIPFFTSALAVVLVCLVVSLNRERILNRYLARVQNAYTKLNGPLGVRYAQRWCDDPEFANPERRFLYALVQIQSGDDQRAQRVLEELSPEDATGLGLAHYWRANKYVSLLQDESLDTTTRDEAILRFRWHLERVSGVSDAQIAVLKAVDAFLDGRPDDAEAKYLELWQSDPTESLGFAGLLKKMGREEKRIEILQGGAERLGGLLRLDPWNRNLRLQLAGVFETLGEWNKAELVLQEGYQINKDQENLVAYVRFLERRARAALSSPVEHRELSYTLVRLLRTQGASPQTLELISKGLLESDQQLEQIQTELSRWLVEGLDLPIVHMYLALTKILRGDLTSGDWHFQQAYRYDAKTKELQEPLLQYLIEAAEGRPEYQQRLHSAYGRQTMRNQSP